MERDWHPSCSLSLSLSNPLLPPSSHADRPSGRSALPMIRQIVTFIGLRKAKAKTIVKTKKIHIQRGMKRKVGSSG